VLACRLAAAILLLAACRSGANSRGSGASRAVGPCTLQISRGSRWPTRLAAWCPVAAFGPARASALVSSGPARVLEMGGCAHELATPRCCQCSRWLRVCWVAWRPLELPHVDLSAPSRLPLAPIIAGRGCSSAGERGSGASPWMQFFDGSLNVLLPGRRGLPPPCISLRRSMGEQPWSSRGAGGAGPVDAVVQLAGSASTLVSCGVL
jgi:hypothetical protein